MKTEKTKNITKIIPLADRVLIKDFSKTTGETVTKSGIILAGDHEDKSTKKGEVVAVGPGKFDDGEIIPMTVKVGDTVLYSWGDKIIDNGQEYILVRESELLAIVK